MKVLIEGEARFLEHLNNKVALSPEDWTHLLKMTPLGRRVYFQNKGKKLRLLETENPDGEILLAWARFPVKEWGFSCLP
jgi:hypothetical protein